MVDPYTWEVWVLGPFTISLHEDWETEKMTLYCTKNEWPYWQTEFFGDTIDEAKKEAAQRCLTIFDEWAEEARKV